MGQAQARPKFGAGNPKRLAAGLAAAMDKDVEEPDDSTERCLEATWASAREVGENPLGFARSAPFDALSSTEANSSAAAHAFLDELLASPLVGDSCDESGGDSQLVRGRPECMQFIHRLLPGVVETDSWDGTPVASHVWRTRQSGWSDPMPFVELARAHPGDGPEGDFTDDHAGSTCDDGYGVGYQPLTTKAGGRLWSIGFAEPPSSDEPPPVTQLRASYPMQLLVRVDRGRQMLVYEAFEYQPPLHCAVAASLAAGTPPADEHEIRQIASLLKRTANQRGSLDDMFFGAIAAMHGGGAGAGAMKISAPPSGLPLLEACRAYGADALTPLVAWVRWRHSVVRRVRFPIRSIVGARLLVLGSDGLRPHAELPPAEGSEPLESLGKPSRDADDGDGAPRVAAGAEVHGAELGHLAVLVIELGAPGAEGCEYAAMRLWPTSRAARKRERCADWTPGRACSRATRHYLVGDACELRELCEYLAHVSPHLARMFMPQRPPKAPGAKAAGPDPASESVLHSASNSLAGPVARLHPRATRRVPSLTSLAARSFSGAGSSSGAGSFSGAGSSEGRVPGGAHALDTKEKVHAFLARCGLRHPKRASPCLKAGLLNSSLRVPDALLEAADATAFLETNLLSAGCYACGSMLNVTVKEALAQSSDGGDYEDGGDGGAVRCTSDDCGEGNYITGLCGGSPQLVAGKFHNHCRECPGFGVCIGDYRNAHCSRCGNHYFSGLSGFSCPCRGHDDDRRMMGAYDDSDSDSDGVREGHTHDAEPIADEPDALCWSGQLRGVELFEAAAHQELLGRVIAAKTFLLELPDGRRQAALNLVGASLGDTSALQLFARPAAEISAMPAAELRAAAPEALQIVDALRGVMGIGEDEEGDEGDEGDEGEGGEEGEEGEV